MASNIEIKARVADLAYACRLAETISDGPPVKIEQDDTFFFCPNGRLKLRRTEEGTAELIHYFRPDTRQPKRSDYTICEVPDPERLLAVLTSALGILARVIKTRLLYLAGRTRIHVDSVPGLGTFVELEVVLQDSQPAEEGEAIAIRLMSALGISEDDLVPESYADLLENHFQGGSRR